MDDKRLKQIRLIAIFGLATGLIISSKLWNAEHLFPRIFIFKAYSDFIIPAEFWILILLLSCWVAIISCQSVLIISASVFLSFLLAMGDQQRWQPWFYQYNFILLLLALYPVRKIAGCRHAVLNSIRMIIASTYFFSGLNKVNIDFIFSTHPWFVQPLIKFIPEPFGSLLVISGLPIALCEMLLGIGLVTRQYRQASSNALIAMHIVILILLGPFGHNWNVVVWPWNLCMVFFLIVLFVRQNDFSSSEILWNEGRLQHKLVLLFFVLLPAASIFGYWPSYLSSALYSGNTDRAKIIIDGSRQIDMANPVAQYIIDYKGELKEFDFTKWSFDELNVPPYPAKNLFLQIGSFVCMHSGTGNAVSVEFKPRPIFFFRQEARIYNCNQF